MAVTYNAELSVYKMAAASDALTGKLNVSHLMWVAKGATLGDDLLVSDTAGKAIAADTAGVVNYSNIIPIHNVITGLVVTTMTTGYLMVYLEKPGGH